MDAAAAQTSPASNGYRNGGLANGHADVVVSNGHHLVESSPNKPLLNGYHSPAAAVHQQNRLRNAYVRGNLDQQQQRDKSAKSVDDANQQPVLGGAAPTNGHAVVANDSMVVNGGQHAAKNGLIINGDPAMPLVRHIPRGVRPHRRLRIAQIAPLYESVPPKMYGGTERIVYHLTEELVRRGHHVTLFCSADSVTSAEMVFHESWPALRLNPVPDVCIPYQWLMEQVRRRADEFDILHFHTMEHFTITSMFLNRSVTTLHGLLSFNDLVTLFKCFNNVPLISISDDQRTHLEFNPRWVGTVHHGIPRNMLPFTAKPSEGGTPYLAFLGRITDVKRPEWAIEIAVRAGLPLKIAAKVDKVDLQYWLEQVKPLVDKHADLVEYIGEINDSEKGAFLGNALALLFPIDWNEPFGLVMIEAMACGTPVVARSCGSVPEVIEDGVNGIIFDKLDEGVEAVKRAIKLDRAEVRKTFERRFTAEKMAENYLKIYEKMLELNDDNSNKQ